LLLDGKPLPPSAVDILPSAASTSSGEGSLRLVVRLPQSLLGKTVVAIRSSTALSSTQLAGKSRITLPLAIPDQLARTSASIMCPVSNGRLFLWDGEEAGPWLLTSAEESASSTMPKTLESNSLVASASKPTNELSLKLEPTGSAAPADIYEDAVWAQTWIAGGERQDRFVYRLQTNARRLEIALPSELDGERFEAMVGGVIVPAVRVGSGALAVELPTGQGSRLITLELRRRTPQRLAAWDHISTAIPSIVNGTSSAPFVWQLVLPRQYDATSVSTGLGAEYSVGWNGLGWGRQPTQSQVDLEQWTGASKAPEPGPSSNQYLYSAFEAPAVARVEVVRHIWILVAAGLAALAVGLMLVYTRIVRSGLFWTLVCVAAGVLLLAYPEAAGLLVQAITIGGVFTVISALTMWLLTDAERTVTAPIQAAPASSIVSMAATQSWMADAAEEPDHSAASAPSYHPSGSAP
jgi:hypothetical protein